MSYLKYLTKGGHSVTILDTDTYSFRRLPPTFKGDALVGNGLDQEVLKRAGIEEADAFVATTQGDNRNIMAAQIAKHIFNVPKVQYYGGSNRQAHFQCTQGDQPHL